MNMDKNFKLKRFRKSKSRTLIGKIKNLRPTMNYETEYKS